MIKVLMAGGSDNIILTIGFIDVERVNALVYIPGLMAEIAHAESEREKLNALCSFFNQLAEG